MTTRPRYHPMMSWPCFVLAVAAGCASDMPAAYDVQSAGSSLICQPAPVRCLWGASMRPGREIRVTARALATTTPEGDMSFIAYGSGAGFGIVYKSDYQMEYGGGVDVTMSIERSSHRDASENRASYHRVLAGFRWLDPMGTWLETYFAVGGGYHWIEVSGGSSFTGGGAYVGGGIDMAISTRTTVFVEGMYHSVWADDDSGRSGQVITGAAGLSVRF